MKKLVENIAKLQVNTVDAETENPKTTYTAIASKVGTVNRNNMMLNGDCITMERERYPFLYNHGESANDLIGSCQTHYDEAEQAYITEFQIDNEMVKAQIDNGTFDSVSIAYYILNYHFSEDNESIIVDEAILNEVSLVSIGADPDAKLINNSVEELEKERTEFIETQNKLKEIKKNYE